MHTWAAAYKAQSQALSNVSQDCYEKTEQCAVEVPEDPWNMCFQAPEVKLNLCAFDVQISAGTTTEHYEREIRIVA